MLVWYQQHQVCFSKLLLLYSALSFLCSYTSAILGGDSELYFSGFGSQSYICVINHNTVTNKATNTLPCWKTSSFYIYDQMYHTYTHIHTHKFIRDMLYSSLIYFLFYESVLNIIIEVNSQPESESYALFSHPLDGKVLRI